METFRDIYRYKFKQFLLELGTMDLLLQIFMKYRSSIFIQYYTHPRV